MDSTPREECENGNLQGEKDEWEFVEQGVESILLHTMTEQRFEDSKKKRTSEARDVRLY